MWHKQSFTLFWSQSDAYSRRSSLKLTYIHHPLVVCTHQICCAVAVPIALSQDRLLHGHNRLVNWTPCSRMREQAKKVHRRFPSCILISKTNIHIHMLHVSSKQSMVQRGSWWRWLPLRPDAECGLSLFSVQRRLQGLLLSAICVF